MFTVDTTEREAFKVVMPDGHTYRIWANGQTEGFGKGAIIVNRIPLLLSNSFANGILEADGRDKA